MLKRNLALFRRPVRQEISSYNGESLSEWSVMHTGAMSYVVN